VAEGNTEKISAAPGDGDGDGDGGGGGGGGDGIEHVRSVFQVDQRS